MLWFSVEVSESFFFIFLLFVSLLRDFLSTPLLYTVNGWFGSFAFVWAVSAPIRVDPLYSFCNEFLLGGKYDGLSCAFGLYTEQPFA